MLQQADRQFFGRGYEREGARRGQAAAAAGCFSGARRRPRRSAAAARDDRDSHDDSEYQREHFCESFHTIPLSFVCITQSLHA